MIRKNHIARVEVYKNMKNNYTNKYKNYFFIILNKSFNNLVNIFYAGFLKVSLRIFLGFADLRLNLSIYVYNFKFC